MNGAGEDDGTDGTDGPWGRGINPRAGNHSDHKPCPSARLTLGKHFIPLQIVIASHLQSALKPWTENVVR